MAAISLNSMSYRLPAALANSLRSAVADWDRNKNTSRLWKRDASLWTGSDEASWLGWLESVSEHRRNLSAYTKLAEEVRGEGFTDALLLGMGGSSLCPEVLAMTFGRQPGFPEFYILDSTDPAQVRAIESKLNFAKTLFIVASKSGSTLEPNVFTQYFYERVTHVPGAKGAGQHFVAITDPGSKMEQVAKQDGFRHIFHGVPSIGGRYSALSNFGLVPAAVMGLDVSDFLSRSAAMVEACRSTESAETTPGVLLGLLLGVAAQNGRDKLTVFASPGIFDLGAWLEQLVAESTGKDGKAIIPVDRELPAPPAAYGADRIFVYLRHAASSDAAQDHAVAALERANLPVVRIEMLDTANLGQEFFRWEIATAVAGSLLGINPFNQPDVEASKVETRKLTSAYESSGSLPSESPFYSESGIELFADPRNTLALHSEVGSEKTLASYLRTHFRRIRPEGGDYFALLAYVEMNATHEALLQGIRHAVRDARRVATCLGFGPRFLHSTGQAYKGGPNSGVFLQVTCDDATNLPVPGQRFTFGVVIAAQARGDFEVLAARNRRALRVHLGRNVAAGLTALLEAVRGALA